LATEVVHEAEVSRQHARYRIPAIVVISGNEYHLTEWSVSGFSVSGIPTEAVTQKIIPVKIVFDLQGIELGMSIKLEVVRYDEQNGRLAVRFTDLEKQQISLFHYIINAYISGEIVTAGDIISVVHREGFVKKDLGKRHETIESTFEKYLRITKKLMGQAFLFTILFTILWFVVFTLYNRFYIIESTSAKVVGNVLVLRAPDNGVFSRKSSFKTNELAKSGALLGIVKLVVGGAAVIESPCDCQLLVEHATNGVYVERGEPIYTLIPNNLSTFIEAQFALKNISSIRLGDSAALTLINGQEVKGIVIEVKGSNTSTMSGQADNFARVKIKPEVIIQPDLLGSIVSVKIDTLRFND